MVRLGPGATKKQLISHVKLTLFENVNELMHKLYFFKKLFPQVLGFRWTNGAQD
jgi:hypothetical protein